MDELAGGADLTGDGRPDLGAVETSTGNLLRYVWDGTAWLPPIRLGSGFGAMQPLL